MGKSLKGTKTEKNLLAAFAGESQARNRYTYFASQARKEGRADLQLFTETADNEKEHAKVFFKYLEGGDVEITASYPAGVIEIPRRTLPLPLPEESGMDINLQRFCQDCHDEGFTEIASSFEQIAKVEKFHESSIASC
jgi:rubrerythrin